MLKAKFIERKNRFTALVEVNGELATAHIANSGRLRELFRPGREVYLTEKDTPGRKTRYDLTLVKYGEKFVSVDARVPNFVVSEAIDRGELKEFGAFSVTRREIKYGSSRLDILASNYEGWKCFIEVKSVTLVRGETAMFPDAPTERGARHLQELARAVSEGYRSAVVFLIQREDAAAFSPNDDTDPRFGQILRDVINEGVEAYAFKCRVDPNGISIVGSVPVVL